jgi:hypothetical protein
MLYNSGGAPSAGIGTIHEHEQVAADEAMDLRIGLAPVVLALEASKAHVEDTPTPPLEEHHSKQGSSTKDAASHLRDSYEGRCHRQ